MTDAKKIEEQMRLEQRRYTTLIKESNLKWPHPEKIQSLKDMPNYWFSSLLREKYVSYCIFYDRKPLQILEMSDTEVVADLQDKVTEFCEKTNINLIHISHTFGATYYIQAFINMAYDYNINLDMYPCSQGALVPRNFFRVLDKFRHIHTRVNREVKEKLGEIEYFTDDLCSIVISYLY
jgi:hypothetical protein